MLLEDSGGGGVCSLAPAMPDEKLAIVPAVPSRSYFVTNLFSSRKYTHVILMRTVNWEWNMSKRMQVHLKYLANNLNYYILYVGNTSN